jgi:hypothetical protein
MTDLFWEFALVTRAKLETGNYPRAKSALRDDRFVLGVCAGDARET